MRPTVHTRVSEALRALAALHGITFAPAFGRHPWGAVQGGAFHGTALSMDRRHSLRLDVAADGTVTYELRKIYAVENGRVIVDA